jgi:hypothetical protein
VSGIVAIVQAVSVELAARIAAAGLPALVDGAILLGPQHLASTGSPPRVIMVPMGSRLEAFARRPASAHAKSADNPAAPGVGVLYVAVQVPGTGATTPTVTFSAPQIAGGVTATAVVVAAGGGVHSVRIANPGSGYLAPPSLTFGGVTGASAFAVLGQVPEARDELLRRSIGNDNKAFTVWVWSCVYAAGVAAPSADGDWDATDQLKDLVLQSVHALACGSYTIGRGHWIDSTAQAAKLISLGRLYTFELEFGTPILDSVVDARSTAQAAAFAPHDVHGSLTLKRSTGVSPGDDIAITG